jgi:hypothetical protein
MIKLLRVVTAESCWRRYCRVMLVMLLSIHTGDGAAEVTLAVA